MSRIGRWATLGVVALVPLGGLVWLASSAADRAEAGEPPPAVVEPAAGPRVVTPLLSARRVPGVVTGQLATRSMVDGLGEVASTMGDQSCLRVAVDGQVVFDVGGDRPVLPASNQKVVTATVALDVLGVDHTFETRVLADATEPRTLYLVGGGDPLLGTQPYLDALTSLGAEVPEPRTSLEALADQVVAAGVSSVPGGVVGDDSRYDDERYVPSWPAAYRTAGEAGPLSALLVDDGFASITPRQQAADPAVHAAGLLAGLLRDRGVQVGGEARRGIAPQSAAPVASVRSAPLAEVVGELLLTSDDNTAELLLKEMGAERSGTGTRAAGLAIVRERLAAWGVPTEGMALVDGSGLDRGNRLTCTTLLAVMGRSDLGTPVADGLPVAGRTGTLAELFKGNPVEGRLRGKTGSLRGARALTGLLPVEGGGLIDYAFVVNGADARSRANALWDPFGRALAAYPDRPDLVVFSPRPAVAG